MPLKPLILTDKLSRVPLPTIKLMAPTDESARLELFRRKLGALCGRRITLQAQRVETLKALQKYPAKPGGPQESHRLKLVEVLNAIDKELNQ